MNAPRGSQGRSDPIQSRSSRVGGLASFILWLIAVNVVIVGFVQILQGVIILGIVLIVLGFLVGPGGYSIFSGRDTPLTSRSAPRDLLPGEGCRTGRVNPR
jgi:hypothetical protein